MDNTNPEKVITAVREASQTIETRGLIDRQFPDLRKTFTDPSIYETIQSEVVKPVVLKRNITFPGMALNDLTLFNKNDPHGVAPYLNKAYYVMQNKIFFWDYVESTQDTFVHVENDYVVGVGFVPVKPKIFRDDIKHLLVIATTKEIKILAVTCDRANGLQLYETGMLTNTTGVSMTQIIGTKLGRIFMLGTDGNIWELDYKTAEGWFTSKCSKKLHTSSNPLGFILGYRNDPVVQIAVNDSGTVLYQLTENNSIYVTYLGKDNYTFDTVYRNTDTYNEARKTNTSTIHLKVEKFKIVSIHPTSSSESIGYHLVAVTKTGCRLYYNHHKDGQHLVYDSPPNALVTVHVRPASTEFSTTDNVGKSLYSNGLLMMVKNPNTYGNQDRIVTYSPDLGNLGNRTIAESDSRLLEFYNTVDVHGKVLNILEVPSGSSEINELKLSYNTPPRHFVVLTTSGLSVLVKPRPVDMLHKLLVLTGSDTSYRIRDFESFFSHFGFINSCSLCFSLICYNAIPNSNDIFSVEHVLDFVEQGAKVLLEKFGQVPSLLNTASQYTSRHDGLALFIYRVLESVWTKAPVKKIVKADGAFEYKMNISLEELKTAQQVLRKLGLFMEQNPTLFPTTPVNPETQSLKNISELVSYLNEAMSFMLYLNETDINSIITQGMKPESQEQLSKTFLKELLTTEQGRSLTNELSFALINYTFKKYDNTAYVTDVLSQYCGRFCGANDVLLYKAADQIYSTRDIHNNIQVKALMLNSLTILKRIALHIPVDKAHEIASIFGQQNYHIYGVQFALACAEARDPKQVTNAYVEAGCPPNDPRAQIFESKLPFYDMVIELLKDVWTKYPSTSSTVDSNLKEVFNAAFEHDDRAFQYYAYEKFVDMDLGQQLIKQSTPHLEEFLNRAPFTYKRLQLLADYYRLNERYEEAAHTYTKLARLPGENISMDTRIDNLTTASVCAKSVTAPTKQYELFHLMQDIEQLLELARQESIAAAQ